MEFKVTTHYLVVNDTDNAPIIENNNILLQSINDGVNTYVPLTEEIAKEFGVNLSECHGSIENNKDEKFAWQHKSTLFFLEEYKKLTTKFRNPKIKKKVLWEEIAKKMNSNGYPVTADALDRKLRNMKNTYRIILDNNNKKKSTGKGRLQWEYFSLFEDLFQEDKTVNTTPTMSSIINIATATAECSSNSESQNQIDENLDEPEDTNSFDLDLATTPRSVNKTPTTAKTRKAKKLDNFRKRQLDIEEQKVEELRNLRKCVNENNELQKEKLKLLKDMFNFQKSQVNNNANSS